MATRSSRSPRKTALEMRGVFLGAGPASDETLGPAAFVLRSPYLRRTIFEGRRIENAPANLTAALLYRRNERGFGRVGVGTYRDGTWTGTNGRELDPEGLYWIRMVHEGE
jgi:hypothetical protein